MSALHAVLDSRFAAPAVRAHSRRHRSVALFGVLLVSLLGATLTGYVSMREAWLGLALVLLLWLTVHDLRDRRVPNAIVYPSILFGLSGAALQGPEQAGLALAGGALAFGVMLALAVASRGAMGMGDVKTAALCGVFLGPGDALQALALGSLLAAVVALTLLASRRASRGDSMPLVPFLALSTFALVI